VATSVQPPKTPSRATTNGWGPMGLLSLVSLTWGAIFPLSHIAVHEGLAPVTVATVRLILGAGVLIAASSFMESGLRLADTALLRRLAPIAVLLLAVPHLLITWSQYFITSSQSVILMATVPLMTAFFISMSQHRRLAPSPWRDKEFLATAARLLPGFLGVLLLVGHSTLLCGRDELPGILAALLGSASCAKGILMMSRLPPIPAVNVSAAFCSIAAVAMLPPFLLTGRADVSSLSLEAVAATIFLGLVCTGLSSLIHVKLSSTAGPVFASLGFYLSPIAGLTLSALLLSEAIGMVYLAAVTLVLFSVYLLQHAPRR
jgi:drug/metabolite transporter (DMT)-like permease